MCLESFLVPDENRVITHDHIWTEEKQLISGRVQSRDVCYCGVAKEWKDVPGQR